MTKVSGINRNSPSRASIKIVLPPVIPSQANDASSSSAVAAANSYGSTNSAPPAPYNALQPKLQGFNRHLSSFDQPFYDANNYYSIKPSMQQIPEQSTISMFSEDATTISDVERVSPGSLTDPSKYNRYSSASLDSGRGSDSVKLNSGQSNRVSVHSCESIGSTSSNKDSESSQQSSSMSSSSSTSSSFCSGSGSSSSSSSSSSFPNQYSTNRTLSSSSSIVSNCESITTPVGDFTVHSNNVFIANKGNNYANMMPNTIVNRQISATSQAMSGNLQNLVAQAGPPSIAEMILHGISDHEIIHNWLLKIKMSHFEKNFIEAGYDISTISRMNPQDLIAIGITDPKSRSVFTAEIQKLNVPEGIPSFKPDTLEEWLKQLNLHCYYHTLCQQGYSTIDSIVNNLTWEDLEDVGINKLGHQKKILLAIKKIKSLKSKQQSVSGADNQECIYATSALKRENSIPVTAMPPPTQEPNYHVAPTIMHSQQQQMPQHPGVSGMNPVVPHLLPYQDVPIKMYANIKQNSPTHPEQQLSIETCSMITTPNNIVPSALFNAKPQMRTFQQMTDNMNRINYKHNGVPLGANSPAIPYGAPSPNVACSFGGNVPLSVRGRSLESLDNPEMHYYNNVNHQYQNYATAYRPTYQLSNGDLNSINRQTVCYEANSDMNTFNSMNQFANHQNYEIDGTATLNRPKNLIKNKPVAKIVASSRQSDVSDNYDTTSLKSNESSEKMSMNSDCSSETSSIYSSVKKKPPPPPKRVNSIKKLGSNSLPSTPQHNPNPSQGAFSDQVYANLMYLNSSSSSNIDNNINHKNYYNELAYNSQLANENVFASCVKSLTTKFSEIHSLASKDDDVLPVTSTSAKPLKAMPAAMPAAHSTHTLPMNKKEMSFIENNSETVNASSSSSTESMPFAADNVGTIRQKSSNFLQNALKLNDINSKQFSSSSSSSSSSTSSPMFAKNGSLPNSTLNSPLSAVANNFHQNNFANSQNDDKNHQSVPNSNDSRQNVVDSLEDIEIMLANLKTQLDSIE